MICEPYRVGKFFFDGCILYGLWFNDEHLGYFNDFEECQEAAEKHAANVGIQRASPASGEAPLE